MTREAFCLGGIDQGCLGRPRVQSNEADYLRSDKKKRKRDIESGVVARKRYPMPRTVTR